MKTLNVGIVGYGWAATAHLAAINATLSRSTATSMRTQGNLPPVGRGPW